jgi:hypothetical protein
MTKPWLRRGQYGLRPDRPRTCEGDIALPETALREVRHGSRPRHSTNQGNTTTKHTDNTKQNGHAGQVGKGKKSR